MKKVNILIGLALIFISGVMIYLVFAGTKLRKRKMVSWSAVSSSREAGEKIGRFFYPKIKGNQTILINGNDDFALNFFEGLDTEAKKLSPNAEVQIADLSIEDLNTEGKFIVEVMVPDEGECQKLCEESVYKGCVCLGAIKKFKKKSRNEKKYWIHMLRMEQNLSVLFYYPPKVP